eukprot:246113-Rhodomonas_salina.1
MLESVLRMLKQLYRILASGFRADTRVPLVPWVLPGYPGNEGLISKRAVNNLFHLDHPLFSPHTKKHTQKSPGTTNSAGFCRSSVPLERYPPNFDQLSKFLLAPVQVDCPVPRSSTGNTGKEYPELGHLVEGYKNVARAL